MPVADDPNGDLVVHYRAVGKLARGHSTPTHSTDVAELASAETIGAGLIARGVWTEFYVKNIYRRRNAVRS